MVGFAVVLTILGVIVFVAGVVVYANGVGVTPDGSTEGERVKQGFVHVPYGAMFGSMPRSVKVVTDGDASHGDRVMAAGAFLGLVAIVLLCLAVLATVAALL